MHQGGLQISLDHCNSSKTHILSRHSHIKSSLNASFNDILIHNVQKTYSTIPGIILRSFGAVTALIKHHLGGFTVRFIPFYPHFRTIIKFRTF